MVLTLETAALEHEAPAGSLVDLVYRNGAGEISRRRVQVARWSRAGNGFTYLRAYCFLRDEERTFRADRIIEWRVVERASTTPAPSVRPLVAFVPVAPPRLADATMPEPAEEPARCAHAATLSPPVAGATPCTHPAAPARTRGRLVGCIAVVLCLTWVIRGLAPDREPPAPRSVPAPRYVPAAVTPKPVPVEPPVEAHRRDVDSRSTAFRRATGIVDPALEALYRGADRDGDGVLSWGEIAGFQSRLARTCAYRANAQALRPDEFLAQGGGDCEDWALFACGLLRYWGWDPYVGSFAGSALGAGHAVCLARVAERPSRFRAWSVPTDGSLGGEPVKAGWYVPIDYEVVGGLSSAVEEGWRLRVIWTPERLYGERM